MKFQKTMIFIFVLVLAAGITTQAAKVKGSGNVAKEQRDLPAFHNIIIMGSTDVELRQGDAQDVVVEIDDNILTHLKTEVDDETLTIHIDVSCFDIHKNVVYIQIPEIRMIRTMGSGDLKARTVVRAEELELSIMGSGDFDLELDAETVEAVIQGSGDMQIAGETGMFTGKIMGSGDIKAEEFSADKADIRIMGSGDCRIHVKDKLEIAINGSGDVTYGGEPELKKTINGSGDIHRIK